MSELTGQTLVDNYYLRESVGSGGMADVYQAWDKKRSALMAVKVLRRDLAKSERFLQQFTREAEILQDLKHPNIVRLYDFVQHANTAFIVMDWVDGANLRQVIHNSRQTIPLGVILQVLESVCSALNYAHQSNVFHCDIKPANIMLQIDGKVFLTDFGVARLVNETGGGGTPVYMAPEQFTRETIDARTDVYAMGITLFEVLSGGNTPYRGMSDNSEGSTTRERIAWEHLYLPPPMLRQFNPQISPALEKMVNKAISKKPDQRYRTMLELLDAFHSAIPENSYLSNPEIIKNISALAAAAAAVSRSGITARPGPGKSQGSDPPWKTLGGTLGGDVQGVERPSYTPTYGSYEKPPNRWNGSGPRLLCRSGQWSGQDLAIPLGDTTIGRGSQSGIKLNEGTVSRSHAVITRTKRGVYLRDAGSSMGTFVNGLRIQSPRMLKDKDVIQFGYQQVFEFKK